MSEDPSMTSLSPSITDSLLVLRSVAHMTAVLVAHMTAVLVAHMTTVLVAHMTTVLVAHTTTVLVAYMTAALVAVPFVRTSSAVELSVSCGRLVVVREQNLQCSSFSFVQLTLRAPARLLGRITAKNTTRTIVTTSVITPSGTNIATAHDTSPW